MWIIRVESELLQVAPNTYYLVGAIHDSIELVDTRARAQRFITEKDAEEEVYIRQSWDPYKISTYIVEAL